MGDLISNPYRGELRWRIEDNAETEDGGRRRGSRSEQVIDILACLGFES